MIFLLIAGVSLLFLATGGDIPGAARTAWLRFQLASRQDELDRVISDDTTPLRFTVQSGDTATAIGRRLQDQGFIADADLFRDYARLERLDVRLEAGTYFLNHTMSIRDIANALTDSRFSQIVFTILPGQRIEEVADNIDRNPFFAFSGDDFLAVVGPGADVPAAFAAGVGLPPGASLEGFLFPDTYSLPPEATPLMLRDTLLNAFDAAVDASLRAQAAEQGFTLYDMVSLAAIIEREAVHREESPMIASVYRNRLATPGWTLDADPTVQYPLGGPGNWWPGITRADYQGVISPYNTYRNPGLPPTPIASPSLAAIRAAINPEPSPYFFFRADCRGDGYHDFSVTYAEHSNRC